MINKLPKAYSILLIGTGIFVTWLYIFGHFVIGINEGLEGFPTITEMYSLVNNMSIENLTENTNAFIALFMIVLGIFGAGVGALVLFSGGILLLYERIKGIKSYSIKRKPVSLVWQVVCSLLPGFDLWALYRIKKLRIGSIVYVIPYAGSLLSIYAIIPEIDLSIPISFGVGLLFTIFVYLWSRNWNNKLKSATISDLNDRPVFTGL